jgi:heptosyltransferase-2
VRILLIRPGALGDAILTLPVVQALDSLPIKTIIEMMGNLTVLRLFCGRSAVQAVRSFDSLDIAPMFRADAALAPAVRDRFDSYDVIINYARPPDSVFAGNLERVAPGRVSHCDTRPSATYSAHMSLELQRPLRALGAPVCPDPPRLRLTCEDRRSAAAWWAARKLDDRPAVALHAGSGSAAKNWPAERFAAVARYVVASGRAVLLLSGPADALPVRLVAEKLQGVPYTPVADLPLALVAAIVERCAGYVGNDSGITHLAAAVGVPVVAVFGPTDPALWAPRGRAVTVLRGRETAKAPREERPCAMTDVTVDRVVGALQQLGALPAR